ncbi:sialidase family protein, partial [Glycomyces tenuis]|uniref:sialidase family protein n=1 Tax=Glycomyces tenuis TaxID=58116 RepID=UPI00138E0F42
QGVAALAADPVETSRVYAAVGTYTNFWDPRNGAILRSQDFGRTWETAELPFKLGGNMPGRGIGERLAVDPNRNRILYLAAPSGNGLWRSADYGASWAEVDSFPNPGDYVPEPDADPNSPGAQRIGLLWVVFDQSSGRRGETSRDIYVGVGDKENSVYRSTDAGATWERLPGQPTGFLPHRAVFDHVGGYLYMATTDGAGPNDGAAGDVWRFESASGEWTNVSPVPSSSEENAWGYSGLTIDRQNPGTLMVTTQVQWWPDCNIFRTTDGGATWTRAWDWGDGLNRSFRYTMDITEVPWLDWGLDPEPPETRPKLGWWMESMAIDPFDSDRMMYGTGATIYGSTDLTAWDSDDQITIRPMIRGLEETAVVELMSPPEGAPLFSGLGDLGGFRHERIDAIPAAMYPAPQMSPVTTLDYAELAPALILRVGRGDTYLAISTDGGENWTAGTAPEGSTGPGRNGAGAAISATGDRILFAPDGAPVGYSTDAGATWTASTGIPEGAHVESDRVDPATFYGWAQGEVYVSTDGGASFTRTATGLPTDNGDIKAVPGHEGELWICGGGSASGIWRSVDRGATFNRLDAAQDAFGIGFGKAAPGSDTPTVFTIATIDGTWGVFRSDDAGATWIRVNDDDHQYGSPSVIAGDPRVFGRYYLGTNGRGVIVADRL